MPADLHEQLRRRAAEQRVSLSAYVLGLLERAAHPSSTDEWLASLADREAVTRLDLTAALADARSRGE